MSGYEAMHMSTPDSEATAQALSDYCLDRLAMDAPLDRPASPAELAAAAGATVTAEGLGSAEALRLWADVLGPACISVDHPRFLSFIPSAPTKAAVSFDMLLGASSIYGGSWLESSGAVYAENQALRWIADLVGLPEEAGGVFVQGGTVGNLSALVAAREWALSRRSGVRPERWAVCVTAETHSSVKHALRVVMDVDVIEIPGDERGRLVGSTLRRVIAELSPAAADGIFAVVATAGTTNLGVVDDIDGIADVVAEHGWWLHVDGAYGGAALAAPSARSLFAGVERADSFIVDPHKWFFAPFDSCALVYRDPRQGHAAHTQRAGYLDPVTIEGEWNPSDFSIQLSRRARGLPFWFSLAVHGTHAYRDAVEHTLDVARSGAQLIRDAPHLRLLVEPDLSVLIFERIGWDDSQYTQWSARLLEEQVALVTPTKHHGRVCTRFAIVNPRTSVADIEMLIDSMR
ncbi:glutamate/tyrosine decarboxylase-like PLP-dependent enzyme [Jatrophihabitans sp. GAS493]|uniref:pyridoxal phosphate-dependent decarboxylase family protein n=1 Tax=Jatrophihabitans sp. GAS493 TaxID=1907575 RepID=UPI000BC022A7|nr:aminotransferase class V-fold PLP-dependent enzyme [Jatrophihabitans sp. GAS493]SOD73024.1 glutamate/tyrosine decarboxylase-like PLP-dependent enzyme [Jatrophihabitans sp. GAS493]